MAAIPQERGPKRQCQRPEKKGRPPGSRPARSHAEHSTKRKETGADLLWRRMRELKAGLS